MGRPYTCPWCGTSSSIKKGFLKTKTMGKRRIRLCKACGRKFTPKCQQRIEMEAIQQDVTEAQTQPAPVADSPEPNTVLVGKPDGPWTS